MPLKSKSFIIAIGAIILVAVFSIGFFVGKGQNASIATITDVSNKDIGNTDAVDFALFWKTWATLRGKYVAPGELDSQSLVWGAIQGMVNAAGDPYTVFLPPEENEIFQSSVRGDFEGVGMEIGTKDGILIVIAPLEGTPAYLAGIKAGDKILQIDDKSAADISLEQAVSMIRGEKGTSVSLIVLHEDTDEPVTISITRDKITIPVLQTETREVKNDAEQKGDKTASTVGDDIYIIRLLSFSENSPSAFRDAVRDMILSGRQKLILDLRNNPGGYLEAAVDISSWFLPLGDVVVREDFGGDKDEQMHRSRGYQTLEGKSVVILVNGGSASASEILAGALHDHGVATLVGEKTFGKGSVQELVSLDEGSALKVTIARWLTPKGISISKNGLDPDVVVEAEDDEKKVDEQLEKAIEILRSKPIK